MMHEGDEEMNLVINGKNESIDVAECTVQELLQIKKVEMPEMVSVELNGEFLRLAEYASIKVKDGDQIEFLYFMGGGCFNR